MNRLVNSKVFRYYIILSLMFITLLLIGIFVDASTHHRPVSLWDYKVLGSIFFYVFGLFYVWNLDVETKLERENRELKDRLRDYEELIRLI